MPYRPIRRTGPGVPGTIYLIHFPHPYAHARHYRGWCGREEVSERLAEHVRGQGSPLVYAMCQQEGITTVEALMPHVAELRPGTRYDERRYKNRGGASKCCPVCQANRKGGATGEQQDTNDTNDARDADSRAA